MSKLIFLYSSMNAGKSTALLQVAHNYRSLHQNVLLFTAEVDNRYGIGRVTSRLGLQEPAETFRPETDMAKEIRSKRTPKLGCVLVDEAQFLTGQQVRDLHAFAHTEGVPVMCYGLRTDFMGRPFEGASWLLALADRLDTLRTLCPCGKAASMTIRIDEKGRRVREGQVVSIGGEDQYRAVCGNCYYLD